ncbi:MAG: hypothetical protein WC959_03460 [Kiritimatiellales bacterium]
MKKIILFLIAIPAAGILSAVEIVNFNRAGLGSVGSRKADVMKNSGYIWNFSDIRPLIADAGGTNSAVHGGFITSWSPDAKYDSKLRWYDEGFQLFVYPPLQDGYETAGKGILVWNKTDFLAGAGKTATFSADDKLSAIFTGISASTMDIRFVVRQGGVYYVSDAKKKGSGAELFSIKPAAVQWRTISTEDYSIGNSPVNVEFTDVQGVGLYMNVSRKGNQTNIKLKTFSATATVK